MVTKKKPTAAATSAPSYTISNCTITAEAKACSEAAAGAIARLAEASARHADAIKEMALSLRGSAARIDTGIHLEGGN
jgi:hypothetical protein